ncbi:ABC transporter ATP-binding protein [uncultured Lactobacillus sp.]|uniref:ABC transporter ATP-binding protein n=1 Tax=uncultured Lactobacillus sp. TaxID=153152 RepID=UPI0026012209|nr:ABC transporter ATP-binding protein [uncultured Lactobacillus sp.]
MNIIFLLLVGISLAILLLDLVILLKARKKLTTGNKETAAPYDNFSKLTLSAFVIQILLNMVYLWNYWSSAFSVTALTAFFLFAGNLLLEFVIFCDDFLTDARYKSLCVYFKNLKKRQKFWLIAVVVITAFAGLINFFPAP